ncbi:hypothetical protein HDU99_010010, partial [Rhizoclosmatium hyalinum]
STSTSHSRHNQQQQQEQPLDYGDDAYGVPPPISFSTLPSIPSFSSLPPPSPSTLIAFKTLELSSSFEPRLSDFKVAALVSVDPVRQALTVRLKGDALRRREVKVLAPRRKKMDYFDHGLDLDLDLEDGEEEEEEEGALSQEVRVKRDREMEEEDVELIALDEWNTTGDGVLTILFKELVDPRLVSK